MIAFIFYFLFFSFFLHALCACDLRWYYVYARPANINRILLLYDVLRWIRRRLCAFRSSRNVKSFLQPTFCENKLFRVFFFSNFFPAAVLHAFEIRAYFRLTVRPTVCSQITIAPPKEYAMSENRNAGKSSF